MTRSTNPERLQATVFESGASQAVRIPAAFRIETEDATIEKVPEGLLLRPLGEDFGAVVSRLREFQEAHGISDGLIDEIDDLPLDPIPVVSDLGVTDHR
ncbi:hypothetical protein MHJ95_11125 [Corynebacterium imitans]|uniref:antitoxin n=1 Tax=Corynebacterium imitans TaxID=156978 RepID=UPI001EF3177B|nr:hypothetical protein [Corynebacterium imitans]MCG7279525.1 hypothetical protein [Corynebacterium imitans]